MVSETDEVFERYLDALEIIYPNLVIKSEKRLELSTESDQEKAHTMDFDKYQKLARTTAMYPNMGSDFVYPALGLCGESGEVAEKLKKVIRDSGGTISPEIRESLKKELGDVLWYVANLAIELNLSLNDVAMGNIEKLASRKERHVLHGSGDNR